MADTLDALVRQQRTDVGLIVMVIGAHPDAVFEILRARRSRMALVIEKRSALRSRVFTVDEDVAAITELDRQIVAGGEFIEWKGWPITSDAARSWWRAPADIADGIDIVVVNRGKDPKLADVWRDVMRPGGVVWSVDEGGAIEERRTGRRPSMEGNADGSGASDDPRAGGGTGPAS